MADFIESQKALAVNEACDLQLLEIEQGSFSEEICFICSIVILLVLT